MLNQSATVDTVFRALADPTRRAIVSRLSQSKASVSELAEPLEMTLAAVVQQIQFLEECGLISTQKEGRRRMCQLQPEALALGERWFYDRRQSAEAMFDRLGALVESPDYPAPQES